MRAELVEVLERCTDNLALWSYVHHIPRHDDQRRDDERDIDNHIDIALRSGRHASHTGR